MKNCHLYLLVSLVLSMAACSDSGNNENAFQTQIDAVDKAKEVENKILESASRQQQAIEENTQ